MMLEKESLVSYQYKKYVASITNLQVFFNVYALQKLEKEKLYGSKYEPLRKERCPCVRWTFTKVTTRLIDIQEDFLHLCIKSPLGKSSHGPGRVSFGEPGGVSRKISP